jgi:hypothetical protein
MTQKELKARQRAEVKKYREWEDSYERISYATHIECLARDDDALVIQVLHDIPRRYRTKAQEFLYILLTDVRGFVLPYFIPGGTQDRHETFIFLNFSHRMSNKRKMTTIAHEIAHGVLNQSNGGRKAEQEADDLCEKWGLGRAYKSYEQFRT